MCTTWDINSPSIITHRRFASYKNINNITRNLIVVFFSSCSPRRCRVVILLSMLDPASENVGSGIRGVVVFCQRRNQRRRHRNRVKNTIDGYKVP